ncbi:unnamed protein product [Moneuplotes crassus]|uniref:Hexose transporter 1 n=1 Tax=Euplotes crassus TaxID=5936 RepID=A0AAD1UHX6_EUPCR|nr:unnamed protein product [Moneuplotes crassus]
MEGLKVDYVYVWGMAFTSSLGFFLLGYAFAYFNSFETITFEQLKHFSDPVINNKDIFNSVMSGIIPGGAIFGSFMISFLVPYGRRFSLMILSLFYIVGCGITLYLNFYSLLIGRMIMGFCCGAYCTVSPLFIEEISPKQMPGTLGILNQFLAVTGVLFSTTLPFILPYPSEPDSYKTSLWRILFAFPSLFALLQFFLLLVVFRYDTPIFYQTKEDIDGYGNIMKRIYKDFDESNPSWVETASANLIQKKKPESTDDGKENEEPKFRELFTKKYRFPMFVGICLASFHQLAGINAVIFHSNQIFTDGKEGIDADKAGRIGTFFIGITGFLGTAFTLIISKLGKRTIMLWGSFLMLIILTFLGIISLYGYTTVQIIGSNLFVFLFNGSIGPCLWAYCAEILTANGMSLVALVNMVWTTLVGAFINLLVQALTNSGLFFLCAGFLLICTLFILFIVKETKGKSRDELKALYSS